MNKEARHVTGLFFARATPGGPSWHTFCIVFQADSEMARPGRASDL